MFTLSLVRLDAVKWTWRESNPRPNRNPTFFYYHSQFFNLPLSGWELTPRGLSSFMVLLTAQSLTVKVPYKG